MSEAIETAVQIAQKVLAGNVRVASRLISQLQKGDSKAREVMHLLYPSCGSAYLLGVTGPPGAGKSTLVSALITGLRKRDLDVGVVAVDPSSPFSGGAVLGDRDRMEGFSGDEGVFIRSLASRGATGGLCATANDAADIMDAMGKDVVLIETVGVGQSEIEIARMATTVILVLVPGYGDSLQAMKAGVMEIADIIVLNKADNEGADKAFNELQSMGYCKTVPESKDKWLVPIVKTISRQNEGVDELLEQIFQQIDFAKTTGWRNLRQRSRRNNQFVEVLAARIRSAFKDNLDHNEQVLNLINKVESMEVDPYTASAELYAKFKDAYNG